MLVAVVVNIETTHIYPYKAYLSAPSGVSICIRVLTNGSNLPYAFGGHSAGDAADTWAYNLTGVGVSTDSTLTRTQSDTGFIWALSSFATAEETLFEGINPIRNMMEIPISRKGVEENGEE